MELAYRFRDSVHYHQGRSMVVLGSHVQEELRILHLLRKATWQTCNLNSTPRTQVKVEGGSWVHEVIRDLGSSFWTELNLSTLQVSSFSLLWRLSGKMTPSFPMKWNSKMCSAMLVHSEYLWEKCKVTYPIVSLCVWAI